MNIAISKFPTWYRFPSLESNSFYITIYVFMHLDTNDLLPLWYCQSCPTFNIIIINPISHCLGMRVIASHVPPIFI